MMLFIALTLVLVELASLLILANGQVIRSECQVRCGNVTVLYPFGIDPNCSFNDDFKLLCNTTYHPPRLSFLDGGLEIINISINEGELNKYTYVARDCYTRTGGFDRNISRIASSSMSPKFYFSPTKNMFTAVGCDTIAALRGFNSVDRMSILRGSDSMDRFASGCLSVCYSESSVTNGSCSGIGCCQTSISEGLRWFNATVMSFINHSSVWDFNPCSYTFIVDANYYNFSTLDLASMPDKVPTVVDWVVREQSCVEAKENSMSYACQGKSVLSTEMAWDIDALAPLVMLGIATSLLVV